MPEEAKPNASGEDSAGKRGNRRLVWIGAATALGTIITLVSALSQISGVTLADLTGGKKAGVQVQAVAPQAPKIEPAAAPAIEPQITSLTTEIAPIEGRPMQVFHIGWKAGRGAELKFDARRFYLIRFARDREQCILAAPAIHAWGPATNTEDTMGRMATRTLALRLPDERADVDALAERLSIRRPVIESCVAVAARIETPGGDDVNVQKAQCGTSQFEDVPRDQWNYLSAAHELARRQGLAIRTTGLHATPDDVSRIRTLIRRGRYCVDATTPAQAIETGLGG